MTTEQTKLSSRSMAQELADKQQQISIAEFFEQNKQMLGFDTRSRAIVTAVKEAVDNALDATEEAGILPEIEVQIEKSGDYYRVIIEDNGPGITEEQIPKIFGKLLYGSRFKSRTQNRGQQGIGISATVLYAHKTSGKPAVITSKTQNGGDAKRMKLTIDTESNEPEIKDKKSLKWSDKEHGTRIEVEMDANMRGRKKLHKYIRDTALVNPHATVRLTEPKWEFESERVTDELPPETEEIKPHPHGTELGTLQEMVEVSEHRSVRAFLKNDFTKVGDKTADNIISKFKDYLFGREFGWDPDHVLTEEEFKEVVVEAVNGKSPEATDQFADCVYRELSEKDGLTKSNVRAQVTDCARNVERDQDERIGKTVQENAHDVAWEFIMDRKFSHIQEVVDDVTSKRKSDDAVEVLSRVLDEGVEGRMKEDDLEDLVDRAADKASSETGTSIGDTAIEKILDAFWETVCSEVPDDVPSLSDVNKSRDAADALWNAMLDTKVNAPSKKCLSPITPSSVEDGLRNIVDADFYTADQRDGEVYKGSPFIVEAGIAYGGEIEGADDPIDLRRFANRVPLVYQQGACIMTQVTENINWRNYKLSQTGGSGSMPRGPMILMVHIASTNVPFTSEAKDAVSGAEIIEQEVERAIRACARDLKKHLKKQADLQQRQEKRETIDHVLPPLAQSLARVVDRDAPDTARSEAKIMGNLYVERNGDTLSLNSYLRRGISLTVVDGDDEHKVSLGEGESMEIDVNGDELTFRGFEEQKTTLGRSVADSISFSS